MRFYKVTGSANEDTFTYYLSSSKPCEDSASLADRCNLGSDSTVEEVSSREYYHWVEGIGCFHKRDFDVDEEDNDYEDEEYNY